MGFWDRVLGRDGRPGRGGDDDGRGGSGAPGSSSGLPDLPAAPTSEEILASLHDVQARVDGTVPPAVSARVRRIVVVVEEMVPRLDRLGPGSQQAHTVVATATDYLPEAVGAYLRLPRDFADRRVVSAGKTSLMLLCDQLDLLATTLAKICDAVSRRDAEALVVHGAFLAEKFGASSSSLSLPGSPEV